MGSTLGAFLNPLIGWRATFGGVGLAAIGLFAFAWWHRRLLEGEQRDPARTPARLAAWVSGYAAVLATARARRAYGCILVNGMFHAGIIAWLGVYFARRYGLGDQGIGLALLGYGVPGMLLGPALGRAADRVGRRVLIPAGLAVGAAAAAGLAPHLPVLAAAAVVTVLSLGFDMSHPLLAGIITSLDPRRVGQAMGLNAFILFTGFGLGSLLFQLLLARGGFGPTLTGFAVAEAILAALAVGLFRLRATRRLSRLRTASVRALRSPGRHTRRGRPSAGPTAEAPRFAPP